MPDPNHFWMPDEDELLLELRNKRLMFPQIVKEMAKAGFNRSKKSCASRHRYLCGMEYRVREPSSRHINWPCDIQMLACHRPWRATNESDAA